MAHPLYAAALLLVLSLPAHALRAGDLMFTYFNADNDGWSVVALVELAPNTTVYFTDNRWDSAAGLFVGSESHHRWNSGPRPVTAGTVVSFSQIDHARLLAASTGTLSRQRVAGSSTYGLSQTEETVYAYQGSSATAPTQFITAVSTAGFAPGAGSLDGTGLTKGVNATALGLGSDFAEYAGPRAGQTAEQFVVRAAQASQWADLGDLSLANQAPRLTTFAVTAVPEPGPLSLAAIGAAVLLIWRRRSCSSPQHLRQGWKTAGLGLLVLAASGTQAAERVTKAVDLGALGASIAIGHVFNDFDASRPGLQLPGLGTPRTLNADDTFVDQYRFSVTEVSLAAWVDSLDQLAGFNVDALQLHLFGPGALQLSDVGTGQGISGRAPTATGTGAGAGESEVLQPLALQPGTYVMEVRGKVSGLSGSGYGGFISLTPVPESSAWLMALSGLGVLALAQRSAGTRPLRSNRSIRITVRHCAPATRVTHEPETASRW